MSSLCLLSEIDSVTRQLAEKQSAYAKAMKEGKEFSHVKKIFLEIKELRGRLQLLVRN